MVFIFISLIRYKLEGNDWSFDIPQSGAYYYVYVGMDLIKD